MSLATPDDGFKPAGYRPLWHDAIAGEDAEWDDIEDGEDPRCPICNARPGQAHLATGRYA